MALDERYIVASDLEQYFVDKDSGLPLSNGTISFYRDIARNVPKQVFQLSGAPPNYTYTSMGAIITLSAVGTVQNSGGDNEVIYYYPYDSQGNLDLYYVVVRDQNGVEQFTREAWPNVAGGIDPTKDQSTLQNQISNPTFTNVLINEGKTTTFTVSSANNEVFELAPNWDFVISGTGTVVVQRIAITGNEKIPTSPPYVLDIDISGGITQCYLRQRFRYNSGLWSSTVNNPLFLAGSFLARNENAGTTGLQMFYVESSGGIPIVVVDGSVIANYVIIQGSTTNAIPQSSNTDSGKDGYVDIYLSFTSPSHVRLSSIQVIPTASQSVNIVAYDTNSSNREEALQGDYYIPRLVQKNAPSFLTGWDFPLNPFQFGLTGNLPVFPSADYIADQTIALRGSSGNVAWGQSAAAGITFTTSGTNDAFYLLQYLTGGEVKKMLGNRLSVNVFGYQNGTDPSTMRVYLYSGRSSSSIPTLPNTIGTVSGSGTFALTVGGWSEIPRSGLDTAQANLSQVLINPDLNNGNNDYGFSGWEITDSSEIVDTDKFAIVVTFHYPDAGTVVNINSISLVAGDLPCRPSPLSQDEVIRQCQYYYEKSYDLHTVPGTITASGAILSSTALILDAGVYKVYIKSFHVSFKQTKRIIPDILFYSPTSATSNSIYVAIHQNGGAVSSTSISATPTWSTIDRTPDGLDMFANDQTGFFNTGVAAFTEGLQHYHYIADARLGVI